MDDVIDWAKPPTGMDTVAADLRRLKAAAGDPSYAEIARRVARERAARGVPGSEQRIARTTVFNCFSASRRRVDNDLVTEIAVALGLATADRERWSARLRLARAAADGAAIAIVQDALPSPVDHFTGRRAQLDELASWVRTKPVWVSGIAGAGKSQLVLKLAQELDVPALLLDLRGHHGELQPVDPKAAQSALLRSLDVAEQDLKRGHDPAEVLRGALGSAGRLLVLEDALNSQQVSAIVGSKPGPGIVVTSRREPPEEDSAWRLLALEGLSTAEIAALLAVLKGGPISAAGDEHAVETLAELTGGAPLAVSLVGGRLARHRDWTLAEHVELMAKRLAAGQLDHHLRAQLDLSYAGLSETAATLLRRFADLPVAELGPEEMALLVPHSRAACAELAAAGLVIPVSDRRIALHALLRAYGKQQAEEADPPRVRNAAFRDLTHHLTQRAWAAYATLAADLGDTARQTTFDYRGLGWSVPEAKDWLRTNLSALVTCAYAAPERGHPEFLFRISEGLSWWLNLTGLHATALRLHEAAADLAAELGEADALAKASLDAGQLLVVTNQFGEAAAHFGRARRLIQDAGELSDPGVMGVLDNMAALIVLREGRPRDAAELFRRAAAVHRQRGETPRLLSALNNLSLALFTSGDFEGAAGVLEEGLDEARTVGNRMFEAYLLANRAGLRLQRGEFTASEEDASEVVAIATELEVPYLQVSGTLYLVEAVRRLGRTAEAQALLNPALEQARTMRDELLLTNALLRQAEISLSAGAERQAAAALAEVETVLTAGADHVQWGHLYRLRAQLAQGEDRAHLLGLATAAFRNAGSFLADEVNP